MAQENNEAGKALWEFREYMFHDIVPIEDVKDFNGGDIEAILPFWRKKGLIPFIARNQRALQVSFAEIIWLRILDTLREFGYPIAKMQMVTDYFFKDAYEHNLPKINLEINRQRLEKKKKAGTLTDEDERILSLIEYSVRDEAFLHIMKLDVNYLTNLVVNAIESGEDRGILIFHDGTVAEFWGDEYHSHTLAEVDITNPHIYLSIAHFLSEFFDHKEIAKLIIPMVLSDDEKRVFREMKAGNIKELKISFANGKPIKIDVVKQGIITGKQAEEIRKVLGLKNYEKIELATRDEKTLSFTKTKKK